MTIVSVIIPFFYGDNYLEKLKKMLETNATLLADDICLEVLIVNDSPWVQIDMEKLKSQYYTLRQIEHKKNAGIHQARITGLKKSSGDYLVFLDQDDLISDDFIAKMLYVIKKDRTDCVISNGIYESNTGRHIILNSYGKVHFAIRQYSYLIMGNLLCSPGQCILDKKAIPEYWQTHIMKSNCSDDLFLWCILFRRGNISYCNELLYTHVNTGANISLDKRSGYESDLEMYNYIKESNMVPRYLLYIFKLRYKYNIQKINKRIDNPVEYVLYSMIKNIFKLIMYILGIIYAIFGKKIPHL